MLSQIKKYKMKKFIYALALLTAVTLTGCGGDSPEAVSKKWCGMTAEIDKAEGEAREKLVTERKEFEESVEAKHKDDDAFMDKVKELTRECDK